MFNFLPRHAAIRIAFLFFALLSLPVSAFAQAANGAAVPEAEVTLKSPSQGTSTVIKTNKDGIYSFDGVNVGSYITERFAAELRGEFFNVTNNQNFDTPSVNLNVTSANTTNFLNTSLQNGGSRIFRVGAKIKF
jgi:hypothetical protein